jgi:HK97 family phage prohead protease
MIYSYKNIDLEIKDVDKKQGIVSGYFAAFGMKDSDGDIIHPGAFTRSISEWGPSAKGRIKHLQNHDPSKPLGKILELKEDSYGLFYRSKIGSHTLGLDFIKMIESDLIKEHSIGFNDLTPNDKRKGQDANNIRDVKLYEGSSLTGWGSNEFTPLLEAKGDYESLSERLKAFEKFVRETDASDETIDNCLIYIKQLGQAIENLNITPSAGAAEQKKDDSSLSELNLFILKHF